MSPLLIRHRISIGSTDSNDPSPRKFDASSDRDQFQREMQDWSKRMERKVTTKPKLSIPSKMARFPERGLSMSLYPVENHNQD